MRQQGMYGTALGGGMLLLTVMSSKKLHQHEFRIIIIFQLILPSWRLKLICSMSQKGAKKFPPAPALHTTTCNYFFVFFPKEPNI
jgi:hypothetical protein